MKTLLLTVLLLISSTALGAHPKQTTYYNRYRQPIGSSSTYKGQTTYYNSNRQNVGRSTRYNFGSKTTINYYNRYGQPTGQENRYGFGGKK